MRPILIAASLLLGACSATPQLQRTPVNPWPWGEAIGMHQAEIVSGERRTLYLSGQTALDADGKVVPGLDLRAQFEAAFANLDTVLKAAGMTRANVVRTVIYTTDIQAATQHWDVYMQHFGAVGSKPPASLIGVAELAFPGLLIEIEATAVD